MTDPWNTLPPVPAVMPFECDWGHCTSEAKAWRWDPEGQQWLPVCATHERDQPPSPEPTGHLCSCGTWFDHLAAAAPSTQET